MRPRHVLYYFILFLLPAIACCVSEELVVMTNLCLLFAFYCNWLRGVSHVGAWNEKRGGG